MTCSLRGGGFSFLKMGALDEARYA